MHTPWVELGGPGSISPSPDGIPAPLSTVESFETGLAPCGL